MKNVLIWSGDLSLVKGYTRSIVLDSMRGNFKIVPIDYQELINKVCGSSFEELQYQLSEYELKWLSTGMENEYFLEVPEIFSNCFPENSTNWESAAIITNAVFHFGDEITDIISFLKSLHCRNVLVVVNNENELINLVENYILDSDFRCIDIIVDNPKDDSFDVKEYLRKFPILRSVKFKKLRPDSSGIKEVFTPVFANNFEVYRESLNQNVYFNQKLYINRDGGLHNSVEDQTDFGNLKKTNPKQLISKDQFRQHWFASKEKTDVCKDCEFRRMCIDNRIPIKRAEKEEWYHESECSYNPYISKWSNEEGYYSLKEIEVQSTPETFEMNPSLVEKVKSSLWESYVSKKLP